MNLSCEKISEICVTVSLNSDYHTCVAGSGIASVNGFCQREADKAKQDC